MPLPLTTRGSEVGHYWPTSACLAKCYEVASNPEVADYLSQQFTKKLSSLSKHGDKNVFVAQNEETKEYARAMHLQCDGRDKHWNGTATKTDFQNLQNNIAESILKDMPAEIKKSVKMNFALSDNAELLRAFFVNGKEIDETIAVKMDALLNSCLAENNLLTKEGTIYDADEKGNICKDAEHNEIRASAKNVQEVISTLLQPFLKEKGMNITTEQQQWPEQQTPAVSQAKASVPQQNDAATSSVKVTSPNNESPSVGSAALGG